MFQGLLDEFLSIIIDFFVNTLIGGIFDFLGDALFGGADDPLAG